MLLYRFERLQFDKLMAGMDAEYAWHGCVCVFHCSTVLTLAVAAAVVVRCSPQSRKPLSEVYGPEHLLRLFGALQRAACVLRGLV